MVFKKIISQLNIYAQCKKHKLSFWQCPQFLFLVMGIIIIISMFIAHALAVRYIVDPPTVILIVFLVTMILLTIAVIITKSFEKLAEASKIKSEFIGIVSHQLRSPLTNLKWVIELFLSGQLGRIENNQLEYFKILKENSARMEELVNDLLVVVRIESGDLSPKKKTFSLGEMIKSLVSEFKLLDKAINTEIKIKVQPDLPLVFADSSQIKLVVGNLLDNAIRYTISSKNNNGLQQPKEKGWIDIKLEQNKDSFYFEIKDNGVGIPKEDQKYIFQKFFRSKNILQYQTEGSGLGLYIAKAIVVKSGGRMGFESVENKGSTFWFKLPIK